jgi:hypothetical protein
MARSNFVQPDMVTLPLSDGDFIVVKKQLTAGEERKVFAQMVKSMVPGEKMDLDPEKVGLTKMQAYLLEWGGPGFMGANGKPVDVTTGNIEMLRLDKFTEIQTAIDAHEKAQLAARDAEKNDQAGASKSEQILLSAG